MNLRRIILCIVLFIDLLPVFSQKAVRSDFFEMLNRITLQEKIGLDNYFTRSFANMMDHGTWNYYIDGNPMYKLDPTNSRKYFVKQSNDRETRFMIYHPFEGLYSTGDSISFCGRIKLEGEFGAYCSITQGSERDSMELNSQGNWNAFRCTIPYSNDIYQKSVVISLDIYGSGKGSAEIADMNVFIDELPIDEVCPLPLANKDHEFDNGTPINLGNLSYEEVDRLALICKIWGFLKYYHPSIAQGDYDWNYQLFRIILATLHSDNNNFFNDLCRFIPSITGLKKESNDLCNDSIISQIQMLWLEDSQKLGSKLQKKLFAIKKLERSGFNYAVGPFSPQSKERLICFRNETDYDNIPVSDDGYRILCLFRFWNMMYYFHPYMEQKEDHWLSILPQYIRLFANARKLNDFDKACAMLACELKDTHTTFYGFKTNLYGFGEGIYDDGILPIDVKLIDSQLFVTEFLTAEAVNMGLQIGDCITHVNGRSISTIRQEKDRYLQFANDNANQIPIVYTAFHGDSVTLNIKRHGIERTLFIRNWKQYARTVLDDGTAPMKLMEVADGVFYINLSQITSLELKQKLDSIKDSKGIIFDMQGYPFDQNSAEVLADYLYPKPACLFYYTYADLKHPGIFRKNPNMFYYGKQNPDYYKGKVVVLVGGGTMSKAEQLACIIGASPKGRVIGKGMMTGGVWGNTVVAPFTSGNATRYTNIGTYYLDGYCTYPNGVKIDQVIPFSVKEGKDAGLGELIEYALSYIDGN